MRIISEQQEQLMHAAKFSALGEMAAGVAHEINNPLTIIKSKVSRLARDLLTNSFDKVRVEEELKVIS